MRTGYEVPPPPTDQLEQLEQKIRYAVADLTQALMQLPDQSQLKYWDREIVRDIHWNTSEALRIALAYRSRLVDRLAGATPGQSHYASLHDPPDACPPGESPP